MNQLRTNKMNYKNLFQAIAAVFVMYAFSYGGFKLLQWIKPEPEFIFWTLLGIAFTGFTVKMVKSIYKQLNEDDKDTQV